MGFISDSQEQLKKALTPKLNWKGAGGAAKGVFTKKATAAVIMKSQEEGEFALRYRNLRFTAMSSAFFFAIALVSILFASSYKDFFFSLMASILFAMFYFRYSFMLWVCRNGWLKWASLNNTVRATGADFIRAVSADPAELLPLALPEKPAQEKGASK
ncbi:hypothetical protein [Pseudomonas sp. PLMAX]|jgi:hypothetical protein|uniref:hypothetical protein n=1 Tax=Pseudomonas sp. PLMAX TaxID=2201998 RepID=UPI0038BA2323